jgi:hypothetical protein
MRRSAQAHDPLADYKVRLMPPCGIMQQGMMPVEVGCIGPLSDTASTHELQLGSALRGAARIPGAVCLQPRRGVTPCLLRKRSSHPLSAALAATQQVLATCQTFDPWISLPAVLHNTKSIPPRSMKSKCCPARRTCRERDSCSRASPAKSSPSCGGARCGAACSPARAPLAQTRLSRQHPGLEACRGCMTQETPRVQLSPILTLLFNRPRHPAPNTPAPVARPPPVRVLPAQPQPPGHQHKPRPGDPHPAAAPPPPGRLLRRLAHHHDHAA